MIRSIRFVFAAALLVSSILSGCLSVDDVPQTVAASASTTDEPAYRWINITESEDVPAQVAGCFVAVCLRATGYSHKFADIENATLEHIIVTLAWDAPAALCGNLRATLFYIGSGDNDGDVVVHSGPSPLQFEVPDLSFPLMSGDGGFLRLSVHAESYHGPSGRIFANQQIEYTLEVASLVRTTQAEDSIPGLTWDEPLLEGDIQRCVL